MDKVNMRIVGLACGAHDTAYSIMEDGKTITHEEYERFSRVKEQQGDVLEFFFNQNPDIGKVDYFTHFVMRWRGGLKNQYPESFKKMESHLAENGGKYVEISHHKAHAANAFFSSNFDNALIVTMDGGGEEEEDGQYSTTCFTIYAGKGNKIKLLKRFPFSVNIGGFWSAITKQTYGYSSGPPKGNQCGTVMAMSAYAKDPNKYLDVMSHAIRNCDYSHFPTWANFSFDEKLNLAAALQSATESYVMDLIKPFADKINTTNLCLAGGVALNSVMTGRMFDWYEGKFENIYVCPVPYDAGLAIGCSQYIWHCLEGNPREYTGTNFTPYLGKTYPLKDVEQALEDNKDVVSFEAVTDEDVLIKLKQKNIIAVFGGGSESGRRALGNRSILADPTHEDMKDILNERVKHRAWFRPFAPSILREKVAEWFTRDVSAPYMGFVLNFKEEMKDKVPAVLHADASGRLQTVTKDDNEWYHRFLTRWNEKYGVPILLNTSFNDREPIVENPSHAMNCFLGTNIDYLYYYDYGILVRKK
jgi:carbamoyltransferase